MSNIGGAENAACFAYPRSGEVVAAELAGQVLRLVSKQGDSVAEGDVLLMLEALKMEIEVKAPRAGTVSAILVTADQTVAVGDALVELA